MDRFFHPFRNHLLALAGGCFVVPALALLGGFVWFVAALETDETIIVPRAQGIVAFTGGADRIADAVDLIATGHADRMLISGVNQSTTGDEIARLTPGLRQWFDCCIDLGYDAVNTIGNAVETRDWAQQHRITRSLIVVTSNYHMPRAILELRRALPAVELLPFPVVSERVRGGIWSDWQVARAVAVEYLKYVASLARIRPMPPASAAVAAPAVMMWSARQTYE